MAPDTESKVVEGMNQADESLARRLQHAALARAQQDGALVDGFVLDADGVLDLREFDRAADDASTMVPAAALAAIRGQLGDAAEVSDLYSEETDRRRWRFGRRVRPAIGFDGPPSRQSAVPLASLAPSESANGPGIDLRDENHPEVCPQCGSHGRRDLLDRFNDVEFYSCDLCLHMWQRDCT